MVNIKVRKVIHRIPPILKLMRFVVDVQNKHFYDKFCKNTDNIQRIEKLKNKFLGETCFIVGNGPSLTMEDLELIKDKDCFAANLIFKIFDKTQWRPKYYFIQDRYADTGNVLDDIDLEYMFIGDYYWRVRGMHNPNAICIHSEQSVGGKNIKFSEDISKSIVSHETVTYSMIQAAVYMGYKKIYLLGMDHSYTLTYNADGTVFEDKTIRSHIFEDKNAKEVIANVVGMNQAYIRAREFCESNNIKIYNATRGGKLNWFDRITLEEAVK
ncbi:hypothetical protein CYQ79_09365 [Enterococcus faecium]|uniref:6-hydroxymethylpterin diphosphokinase MptE-like protein n=1 Tax=Enterococcus faecium TaxID=1352 RepID=UPI00100FFD50|nr:6-hydroxymethylpterin diphosphokinase MptE-like protein [Enterococcus faecium]RXW47914.1 hypothetical protein CYQ79_09365 [Enterococcus faecium]